MKYRKKPVVIEAVQFTGGPENALHVFDTFAIPGGKFVPNLNDLAAPGALSIPTLEGVMRAEPGDYIIKGVKGEFYPCKPDIFAASYEPAEWTGGGGTGSSASTGSGCICDGSSSSSVS